MVQTDSHQIEDRWWNLAIFLTTACTLGIVLVSHYFGYSVLFTHLFYIPIVLVAYRYPARGIYFASLLGLAYFASDIALNSPMPSTCPSVPGGARPAALPPVGEGGGGEPVGQPRG